MKRRLLGSPKILYANLTRIYKYYLINSDLHTKIELLYYIVIHIPLQSADPLKIYSLTTKTEWLNHCLYNLKFR